MNGWRLATGLIAILGASPADARQLWKHGDASLELTGSVRELLTLTEGTDVDRFEEVAAAHPAECFPAARFANCPAFGVVGDKDVWQSLSRFRIRLDAQATNRLSAVVSYDNEVQLGILETFDRSVAEEFMNDTLLDLDHTITRSAHSEWRHRLYRAYANYEGDDYEITLGRQRIPWGVGRLWNPIDRFNPIGPLALEPDQTQGVDGVRAVWWLTGFTYLEADYTPNDSTDDAAYALRLHGVVNVVDYSLIAGVFDEALTTGFDLAANLGGAAVRAEVVYTNPTRDVWPVGAPAEDELAAFWQVLGSIDYSFPIGRGVYVLLEHLYNGNALGFGKGKAGPFLNFFESTPAPPPFAGETVRPASTNLFGGSGVVTFARHQTGFQVGTDLTSILRGDFLAIYDWNGESVVLAPTVGYSPTGSIELTLGFQGFLGPDRSQYGSAQNLVYLLAEFFF